MDEEAFWVSVLALEALGPNNLHPIQHGQRRVALFNVDGEIFATDDICSSDLSYLTDGQIEDDHITWPFEDERFNIRTGRVSNAGLDRRIKTYPVRILNGNIEIRVGKSLGRF